MATDNPNEQKPSTTEQDSVSADQAQPVSLNDAAAASTASSGSAAKSASNPTQDHSSSGRSTPWWMLLLLLMLAAAVAVMGYFGWFWQQQQQQQNSRIVQQLQQQSQQLVSAQQQLVTVEQGSQNNLQQWNQSLGGLEQRLESHSRRLRALSTTTRDDWLLAEVEYLLRLASQRLQMERGPKGALALLQSADDILLELDDAELFPVRDKLQRDITALKLTPSVDRSGLYLKLAALSDEIQALPQVPRIDAAVEQTASSVETAEPAASLSLSQKLQANFLAAMSRLGDQVRVRHHDQPLEPLLPPDGARYLRQNLRFNIEQAQLAMLREETAIYQHSLNDAEQLLRQYFATQQRAQRIADQLSELKSVEVETSLPGIGGSLAALQDFTARLHRLDERAGSPQLEESPQAVKSAQQAPPSTTTQKAQ